MTTSAKVVPLIAGLAIAVTGCGGSDTVKVTTGESIDPQVFKQNAETYIARVKGIGGELATCITQSLSSGAIAGGSGGQKNGQSVEGCIKVFAEAIKQESAVAQGATLTYIKGVTSPCREKAQSFEDDIKSITDSLTKAASGSSNQSASKLIATLGDNEVQGKLRDAKATLSDMVKTCSGLAPKGN